ncbi:MAG: amino acid adenylation domain-containing protein [Phycisphaerae bacterium]|nr:amino acid adenylation domain-containing protein [Phycisphaerae bacterium]
MTDVSDATRASHVSAASASPDGPHRANEARAGADEHLLDVLDRVVAAHGNRVAIELPPSSSRQARMHVTYAGLDRAARAIASELAAAVARRDEPIVAIAIGRDSPLLYAAQLAAWHAGAAFTCVDPSFPLEHVRSILADADACAVLGDATTLERFGAAIGDRPRFDVQQASCGRTDDTRDRRAISPHALAYVIYTSGTTGEPKGVMIEHGSIANLVRSDVARFRLSRADRVAQCSSPAYDSSLEESWLAFAVGATLVPLDDETVRLGPDLVPWLARERISVLCPPPTLLRTTGCADPKRELPHLKLLYVGGEALPQDLSDLWGDGRWLENGYGPTECTVTVVRGRMRPGQPVSIGQPVDGHRAFIMDESLAEVPDGDEGELCIAGVGLARGYRNRPDLTQAKFPFVEPYGRLYRTGDLARRRPNGDLEYLGRLDGQVKVRGYRVELPAIDAHLATLDGVREAATAVVDDAIVAHVVPKDRAAPPEPDALRTALLARLPSYMVPSRIGFLDALPRTVGGKIDRKRLPRLAPAPAALGDAAATTSAPDGDALALVLAAFRRAAKAPAAKPTDDFFLDLGGDSLGAVAVLCDLRRDPRGAAIAVRHLYELRTAERLAARIAASGMAAGVGAATTQERRAPRGAARASVVNTALQAGCLVVGASVVGLGSYAVAFAVAPALLATFGPTVAVLLAPFLTFAATLAWAPLAVLVTAILKAALVGRYEPGRIAIGSRQYLRHWIVERAARLIPWRTLEGTTFHASALRALGATIGERVHIHRGVDLRRGGWDLLELGDDVTLAQDSSLQLVEFDDGHLAIRPISIGAGATIGVRATVDGGVRVAPGVDLAPLSWLKEGTATEPDRRYDGVPARATGAAEATPRCTRGAALSPWMHGVAMLLARLVQHVASSTLWVAVLLVAVEVMRRDGRAAATLTDILDATRFGWIALATVVLVPIALVAHALSLRFLGRIAPGVISRYSVEYAGVWAKTAAVDAAGRWLSGTLFWPWWLRLAGMRIGRTCEVSTIIDVVPESVSIGRESFFADGVYFASPVVRRGTVTIADTSLGAGTFLGNHCVVPAGHAWPDGLFVGVSTVADRALAAPNTGWFGHPPMELPSRDVVEADRRVTFDPPLVRVVSRVFWESLRFAIPLLPLAVGWWWIETIGHAAERWSRAGLLLVVVPLATLAAIAVTVGAIIALKWLLLGRVKPGRHPLWSCWCSRWDFLYVAWTMWARSTLLQLEGTVFLAWFLRSVGVKVGRNVVLGTGFAQVVDPDMLSIGDDATVVCHFQAHTFEDRVLKIDHVAIGAGATIGHNAVVFYGVEIGDGAHVAPHSVVMKNDQLAAGETYEGAPAARIG